KLSGRQFEVGDKANFVRNSRNGQIWSVKYELLRFAVQILSPSSRLLKPINHCTEMLTRTLRSEVGLSAQPPKV
ncbi:TPA: hypothetical protein ACGO57_001636, partial [Streptococcus suis]